MSKYGIILAVACALQYGIMKWHFTRTRLPAGTAEIFSVLAISLSLILARLVFCLTDIGYFINTLAQPDKMFRFYDGGFAMTGVFLGLALSGWCTAKIMKRPLGSILDTTALAFGLPLCVMRLAEGTTTLGIGREVLTPLLRSFPLIAVEDEMGVLRHAVYRYEAVIAAVLFIVMIIISRKNWRSGDKALLFITLYGSAQAMLESMRDDFHLMWGFVRAQQVYAIGLPLLALILLTTRLKGSVRAARASVLAWTATVAGIALAIIKEFDMDTSRHLFWDYTLMAAALAIPATAVILLLRRTNMFNKDKSVVIHA